MRVQCNPGLRGTPCAHQLQALCVNLRTFLPCGCPARGRGPLRVGRFRRCLVAIRGVRYRRWSSVLLLLPTELALVPAC